VRSICDRVREIFHIYQHIIWCINWCVIWYVIWGGIWYANWYVIWCIFWGGICSDTLLQIYRLKYLSVIYFNYRHYFFKCIEINRIWFYVR